MNHTDHKSIEGVLRYLRMYGFDARVMYVRQNKKSCDIVARYGRDTYYIEIKDRLGPRQPGSYTIKYGYSSSVNKVIEKATKQLTSMPKTAKAFRIIWFVLSEDDEEEFLLQAIVATLYGIQRVGVQRGDLEIETDCFYFNTNPASKYRDLDCVIIQTDSGLLYCLNDNSASYSTFKRTKICSFYKRKDGLIDPKLLEREGCCFIARQVGHKEGMIQDILNRYSFQKLWVIKKERHISLSKTFTLKLPKGQPDDGPSAIKSTSS